MTSNCSVNETLRKFGMQARCPTEIHASHRQHPLRITGFTDDTLDVRTVDGGYESERTLKNIRWTGQSIRGEKNTPRAPHRRVLVLAQQPRHKT